MTHLKKNESITLGLAEKRTSIEVQATKQQLRSTLITTKWVNSDRQIADVLTKVNTNPHDLIALMKTGHWKIVWDKNFVSAKNIRKQNRANFFKNAQEQSPSRSTSTSSTRSSSTSPSKKNKENNQKQSNKKQPQPKQPQPQQQKQSQAQIYQLA